MFFLRYVLIYNLEVSFNFQLRFLQLNVIGYFFELQITRTFFRFPLKIRVIGSLPYRQVMPSNPLRQPNQIFEAASMTDYLRQTCLKGRFLI